jgi:hypothetical protein
VPTQNQDILYVEPVISGEGSGPDTDTPSGSSFEGFLYYSPLTNKKALLEFKPRREEKERRERRRERISR